MSTTDIHHEPPPGGADYLAVQASPEFQDLRRTLRRLVFPMTAFFLIWYSSYVLPGAFAHDFMVSNPGIVSIPLAFILGVVGTLSSRDTGDPVLHAEMEVRSLTGVGVEPATHH